MIEKLSLKYKDGHLFLELDGGFWLYDTGAPISFGLSRSLSVSDRRFNLDQGYLGLHAGMLSDFVGVQCSGLLGADVLGNFDHIVDISGGTLTLSTSHLTQTGQVIALETFMGIPIVPVNIGGTSYRFFFDTGAQVSYFQDADLAIFPHAGRITDFYPGVGQFQTDTYQVGVTMGEIDFTVRCGRIPGILGMTLMMAGTQGIIGNQILANRTVGFFPRRGMLII